MPIERMQTIADAQGDLALAYMEWGDPLAERTIVCIHGLTRNARDFDFLAEALAADARVYALAIAGRGRSDWLKDPKRYVVPTYVAQVDALLEALRLPKVDLVGTSMGGIIGMALAAAENSRIERLVVNDVGGLVPKEALKPIATYLGSEPLRFPDHEAVEQHLREIHAPFGPLTDRQWGHLARHSARAAPGGFVLHYDPAIAQAFKNGVDEDIELWPVYDAITCPTLLLRGDESTLLPAAVADEMTRRGPEAQLVTFPGVGHAPALMADDQIEAVRRFLQR